MKTIQFIGVTPKELEKSITESVKTCLNEIKENFEPKTPTDYIDRAEVAEMCKVDVSTVHNWRSKGYISSYQIGRRVLYKRSEVEDAMVKL